jgi:hypothetical protein
LASALNLIVLTLFCMALLMAGYATGHYARGVEEAGKTVEFVLPAAEDGEYPYTVDKITF